MLSKETIALIVEELKERDPYTTPLFGILMGEGYLESEDYWEFMEMRETSMNFIETNFFMLLLILEEQGE